MRFRWNETIRARRCDEEEDARKCDAMSADIDTLCSFCMEM